MTLASLPAHADDVKDATAPGIKVEPVEEGGGIRLEPVDNRFNIRAPAHDRYGRRQSAALSVFSASGEYPIVGKSPLWDFYNTNWLKGDEPIYGENLFFIMDAVSNTFFEYRDVASNRDEFDRKQDFFLSLELFHGDTVFRPQTFRLKVTGALDIRKSDLVTDDETRGDLALQEAFFEALIQEYDPHFDFMSVRLGRQAFKSDFRGFIFNDTNQGGLLFGSWFKNRLQYELAAFYLAEKDPFSAFNRTLEDREQTFLVANLFYQDLPFMGYTLQLTMQHLIDESRDRGNVDSGAESFYFGFLGDGRIGRFDVAHALYWVHDDDQFSAIAGRDVTVNALMAAIEISYPMNWITPRVSAFFASGDADPTDSDANGFDAVFDNPAFTDAGFGFWHKQNFVAGGRRLANGNSLLPNLRAKAADAPNHVNPGIFIVHCGADIKVSNHLTLFANVSWLQFAHTRSLEQVFGEDRLSREIGTDFSLAAEIRPLGIDNLVITADVAALVPAGGFRSVFGSETLISTFVNLAIIW